MTSIDEVYELFLKSNGVDRRALSENSISINKMKVDEKYRIGNGDLIGQQYVLLQRGKKNFFRDL